MGRPKKTKPDETMAMSIRLPSSIRDIIANRALANHRSLNQEIVWLLELALESIEIERASKDSSLSG